MMSMLGNEAMPTETELSLTNMNDDIAVTLLGQYCDLPSVAAVAATCRRFRELVCPLDSEVWRAHLFSVLSVDQPTVKLCENARMLLVHAIKGPKLSRTLEAHPSRSDVVVTSQPEPRVSFAGSRDNDGAVRADAPLSLANDGSPMFTDLRTVVRARGRNDQVIQLSAVSYFEVQLLRSSNDSSEGTLVHSRRIDAAPCVSVGLSTAVFPLVNRQVGWTSNSLGYHSDDGNLFHGGIGSNDSFGPSFHVGDVVGCGIHLPTGATFFTLNGSLVCTAALFETYTEPLYATVGFDGTGTVEVNFGGRVPFRFNPERVADLYDAVPPSRDPSNTSPPRIPEEFVCEYSQASLRHPWSPRGRVQRICLDTLEEDGMSGYSDYDDYSDWDDFDRFDSEQYEYENDYVDLNDFFAGENERYSDS